MDLKNASRRSDGRRAVLPPGNRNGMRFCEVSISVAGRKMVPLGRVSAVEKMQRGLGLRWMRRGTAREKSN